MPASTLDWIVAFCAIGGFLLSIISLGKQFREKRVKLQVIPLIYRLKINEETLCGIRVYVVNLSNFPIHVRHAGLLLDDGKLLLPEEDNPIRFPFTIEPRRELYFDYLPKLKLDPRFARIRAAQVRTECGLRIKGKTKEFTNFIRDNSS